MGERGISEDPPGRSERGKGCHRRVATIDSCHKFSKTIQYTVEKWHLCESDSTSTESHITQTSCIMHQGACVNAFFLTPGSGLATCVLDRAPTTYCTVVPIRSTTENKRFQKKKKKTKTPTPTRIQQHAARHTWHFARIPTTPYIPKNLRNVDDMRVLVLVGMDVTSFVPNAFRSQRWCTGADGMGRWGASAGCSLVIVRMYVSIHPRISVTVTAADRVRVQFSSYLHLTMRYVIKALCSCVRSLHL